MASIPKNLKELRFLLKDPLYRNSLYLLTNNVFSSVIAFFFWIVAARLFSTEEIGIASVLISSAGVILMLSYLGFDYSIIRFFPIKDKSEVFSTSVIVSTTFAIVFGSIFIIGIDVFSPNLIVLGHYEYGIIFLFYIILTLVTTYTGHVFIALRKGGFFFLQNLLIQILKIFFIFILVSWGAIGIFGSFGASTFIALCVSLILLKSDVKFSFNFKK